MGVSVRHSIIPFLVGFILLVIGVYRALTLPPVHTVGIEENYRIVFFHVPAAVSAMVAFTVTFIFSALFLKFENYTYDIVASSSAVYGFAMITAALISGSIWAKVAWNSYWNWDPRETFVLMLWFAYAAYLGIRATVEDHSSKARFSAIYSIFAFVTVPMSYLSSKIFFSLHPTTSELKFDAARGSTLGMMILAFFLLFTAYLILDVKLSEVRERIANS